MERALSDPRAEPGTADRGASTDPGAEPATANDPSPEPQDQLSEAEAEAEDEAEAGPAPGAVLEPQAPLPTLAEAPAALPAQEVVTPSEAAIESATAPELSGSPIESLVPAPGRGVPGADRAPSGRPAPVDSRPQLAVPVEAPAPFSGPGGDMTELAHQALADPEAADAGEAPPLPIERPPLDSISVEARPLDVDAVRASEARRPSGSSVADVSPERAANVLHQVRVRIRPDMRKATLRLDPPELGRIDVRVTIDDGHVRAEIRAETPEALLALERHVPELRASFAQQGMDSTDIDLGLGFQEAQDGSGSDGRERSGTFRGPGRGSAADTNDDAGPDALAVNVATDGGIDFYA